MRPADEAGGPTVSRVASASPADGAGRGVSGQVDRVIERADRAVAATIELLNEFGADFTLEDIVRRSGVSRRALTVMFSGRDDLILAALEVGAEGRVQRQREVFDEHAGDAVAQLRETLRVRWHWFDGQSMKLSRARAMLYPALQPTLPDAHRASRRLALSSLAPTIASLRRADRLAVTDLDDGEIAELIDAYYAGRKVEAIFSVPAEIDVAPVDRRGFELMWRVLSRVVVR